MLKEALTRMSYEGLAQLIPPSVFGIINEFESAPSPTRLAELVIDIFGEHTLLSEKNSRDLIIKYLDRDSAIHLIEHLGLSKSSSPWQSLISTRFTKDKLSCLYDFFSVKEPENSELIEFNTPLFCESVTPEYGLFPHQEEAAIKIKRALQTIRSRVLLHMPTGSGKTRTAMSIICDYLRNSVLSRQRCVIVWLADTEELCDQAASEFRRAWSQLGIGPSKLYRCHGDIDVDLAKIDNGFIVIGLQKLNSISKSQQSNYYQLCSKTKLVVFDEAHKAIASTYKHSIEVFDTIGSASLLGLSATPGRAVFDELENEKFAEFFNYQKVSLHVPGYESPIDYLQSEGYLAKIRYHDIDYQKSNISVSKSEIENLILGNEPTEQLLKRLGKDQKRNIQVLTVALSQLKKDKKIIMFMPSVESAQSIFSLLRYKNIKAGLITSKTERNLRNSYINQYKSGKLDILVNYGVLTTGFDAPSTNVAIIARPTNSLTLFSQMVGRAIRGSKVGGNKQADIFVVKDTFPGLRNMRQAFEFWDDSWSLRK